MRCAATSCLQTETKAFPKACSRLCLSSRLWIEFQIRVSLWVRF